MRCKNCDAKKGKSCPCWFDAERAIEADLWLVNARTGERKPATGCFYDIMLMYMSSVSSAVMQHGAAVESTRNEIVRGFTSVAQVMAASNGKTKQIGR